MGAVLGAYWDHIITRNKHDVLNKIHKIYAQ